MGEQDAILAAADAGFAASQTADVKVWSCADTNRSVIVRGDVVIAVREG